MTIITKEPTHLALLDKVNYLKIFSKFNIFCSMLRNNKKNFIIK